jgi:hypothetical protein
LPSPRGGQSYILLPKYTSVAISGKGMYGAEVA